MKKFVSVFINMLLFVILLVAVGVVAVFLMSYVDIIFTVSVEGSLGRYVVVAMWLLVSAYLYFVFIRKKSGALTGSAIAGASGAGAGLRSLVIYLIVVGFTVVFYGASVLINSHVFGAMVEKEERAMEALGTSLDWKSYFPRMKYSDTDNAASHIEKAGALFTEKDKIEAEKFFKLITDGKDAELLKAMPEVKALVADAAVPLAAFEKALEHKGYMLEDYVYKTDEEIPWLKIPVFTPALTFVRIEMLEAVSKANNGDWTGARKNISNVAAFNDLLAQSPFLASYFLRLRNAKAVHSGLVAMVKEARDKEKAIEFVKTVLSAADVADGEFLRALRWEYVSSLAFQKTISGKKVAEIFNNIDGVESNFLFSFVLSEYYAAFGQWDRYVYLKAAGMTLKGAEERDIAKRRSNSEELVKYADDHNHLPAFIAAIAMTSYDEYIKRKFLVEAGSDLTLLFASAVHYKSKHGNYPDGLDKLVPVYMKDVPICPVDGKPYVYKTEGDYMKISANKEVGETEVSVSIGKHP